MAAKSTNRLERDARALWLAWSDGGHALSTVCSDCGEFAACRGRRRSRMLCLPCFSLSPDAARFQGGK